MLSRSCPIAWRLNSRNLSNGGVKKRLRDIVWQRSQRSPSERVIVLWRVHCGRRLTLGNPSPGMPWVGRGGCGAVGKTIRLPRWKRKLCPRCGQLSRFDKGPTPSRVGSLRSLATRQLDTQSIPHIVNAGSCRTVHLDRAAPLPVSLAFPFMCGVHTHF